MFQNNIGMMTIELPASLTKKYGHTPLPDEVLFSKYAEIDNKQGIFLENYYMYDTINNLIVKIVQPKRIGNGITGIYIPELSDGMAMSIYANNLDSNAHINALRLFRSIKYKK